MKDTITDPHYIDMKLWSKTFDSEPDGAFFALAEEMNGWDIDDWAWYAELQRQDPTFNKKI